MKPGRGNGDASLPAPPYRSTLPSTLALAAGGFFTLFQQYTRQAGVTEVMVYNAEDLPVPAAVMRQGPMRTRALQLTWTAALEYREP